jgi:ATP-dependent RNA helicase SUPV3L1/SUV3
MVIDGDAMSVEERMSPGDGQPVRDFSGLHGFQFVGARDSGPSDDGSAVDDDQRRTALALELDTRAARFHQAVDSAIVLSSDGAIRWLGDSVAKLAAGDDMLAPRTILLVDKAMSADAQKVVQTRIELWLNATIQRLLGPLFSLRGMQEGSSQLQELAGKITSALGVLDRQPVRGVVRNLDQNSRAVLRKQGVRFGSYYLYVPSTLRPASRALALQLWCLQKGDEEISAAAQGLIPMATSGRTSAPPDVRVSSDAYRVGGFRSCGDRVVRVDIVERLADMIRAAATLRIIGGSLSGAAAFQPTSQMTSLTGCSGDGFASILKALGFESVTVPRSEVVWPAPAAPIAAAREEATAAPAADVESADGAHEDNPDEPALSAEADVSPSDPAPSDMAEVLDAEASGSEAIGPSGEAEGAHSASEDVSTSDPAPDDAVAFLDGVASDPEALRGAERAPSDPRQEIETGVEVPVEPHPEVAPPATGDETVTVWRFARPPAPIRHPRPSRPPRRRFPAPGEPRVQPQGAAEAPAAPALNAELPPQGSPPNERRAATPEKPFHGGKRKNWDTTKTQTWDTTKTQRGPDDKRDGREAAGGRPGGERKPVVDPMSPFAKLMELRSILESEGKGKKRN